MFGRNKDVEIKSCVPDVAATIIGPGTVFDGSIKAAAPCILRVDGTVNGDCECTERLTIGMEGQITGNIKARDVTVSGVVTGDICVYEEVRIESSGRVTGNITSRSLVIENGACFDGRCMMAELLHKPDRKNGAKTLGEDENITK